MSIDGLPPQAGPQGAGLDPAQELAQLRQENLRLARQLAEAAEQIDAVNLEMNSLAGRMAHDLQVVMQVTEGFATALQRSALQKLGDRERHYLQRIVETSARGNSLIADLQAHARLRVQPVKFAPVQLGQLVQRAQRAVAPDAQGRPVEWAIDGLPTVWGDAPLLEQMLVHLLSNALKFTRGRDPARIWISAASREGGHEVRVQDNGVGFDPGYADRLFRPFERLHGSEFEGNGMGLAKVRRIVERHGGAVTAGIAPGGGACFTFTLQAVAPDAPAQAAQPEVAAGTAVGAPGALRVLLVDDDPMVLLSLRNMLEADGHVVGTAAGGQIGVDAFEQSLRAGEGFDVVVTDFGMPHMDGREVARLVKLASPATRVIMLTGWQRPEGMADWKAHVDAILSKPPRLAQLRQALAQAQAGPA